MTTYTQLDLLATHSGTAWPQENDRFFESLLEGHQEDSQKEADDYLMSGN